MVENGRREPSLELLTGAARAMNVPVACFFWDPEVDETELGAEEQQLVSRLRSLLMEFHMSLLRSRRVDTQGRAVVDA